MARYTHPDYRGVALVIDGPATYTAEVLVDEYTVIDAYGDEVSYYDYVQEVVESDTDVIVHMVGDDHPIRVARADLTEISEAEYCHECGQIGCLAYAMEDV